MSNATELVICTECGRVFSDSFRLILVGCGGTFLAAVSILENCVLFYVFSTSKKLRRENYANPVLLALFDIVVAVCYIALMSVHTSALAFRNQFLFQSWVQYVKIVYCIQNIASTISNFLLVVASLERYLANSTEPTKKKILVAMVTHKAFVIAALCLLSLIFKATLYFETPMIYLEGCSLFERVLPIWVQHDSVIGPVQFWVRKLCTVILPFVVLAFCNYQIVVELRQRQKEWKEMLKQFCTRKISRGRENSSSTLSQKQYPRGVRTATRTLVMVVGCFFISNSASLMVNFWEYFSPRALGRTDYYSYLLSLDVAYLLMIAGCACRLIIYVVNDERIRKAIWRAFLRCSYRRLKRLEGVTAGNLEKWSIVVVSNSLRSNLTVTNALAASQELHPGRCRKSMDELALLLQNRRRFLVDMTITLTSSLRKPTPDESTNGDMTFLTDIQEEMEPNQDTTLSSVSPCTSPLLLSKSPQLPPKWTSWEATV